MAIIDSIVNYRRYLKRRNCSAHTVKNYMNTLKHFVVWLDMPIEEGTKHEHMLKFDIILLESLHTKWKNTIHYAI